MSNATLLPPNASAQERAMEGATARLGDVPVPVRDAWNPDTCPVALLPWLAWAFSVDEWQNDWTEAEKRSVIRNALYVHKHKGTIGALDAALRPLGYLIEVAEWWEMDPPGEPYTFSIVMGSTGKPITDQLYTKAERIIQTYKNVRSQMRALTIKTDASGKFHVGAVLVDGSDTTVFPYQMREASNSSALFFATACQDVVATSVYPPGWADESLLVRLTSEDTERLTEAGYFRTVEH